MLAECIESYDRRPKILQQGRGSFRDYIISGFGERLADLFLIPQNEKTMAISLDRLSSGAVRRFFPAPDEVLVQAGMRATRQNYTLGYNANFWYPKVGGIGRLVQGLRNGIQNCVVNENVAAVDLKDKTLTTTAGGTYRWNAIFSSMPLKELCRITGDEELVADARRAVTQFYGQLQHRAAGDTPS